MSERQWQDTGSAGELPAPPTFGEKKATGLWVFMLCAVALLVAVVGAAVTGTATDVGTAKVGDCLTEVDRASLRTIDCGEPAATYVVVAIIEGQPAPTPPTHLCEDRVGAAFSYWRGEPGGTGRVLCLKLV